MGSLRGPNDFTWVSGHCYDPLPLLAPHGPVPRKVRCERHYRDDPDRPQGFE